MNLWLYNKLRKISDRLDNIEGIQREILKNQQGLSRELNKMAETVVEKITREAEETRGAVATMIKAFETFTQYVIDHQNDPAALESAALEMQGAQDDIAAAMAKNPLPGEVVVVPPPDEEPPVSNATRTPFPPTPRK